MLCRAAKAPFVPRCRLPSDQNVAYCRLCPLWGICDATFCPNGHRVCANVQRLHRQIAREGRIPRQRSITAMMRDRSGQAGKRRCIGRGDVLCTAAVTPMLQ